TPMSGKMSPVTRMAGITPILPHPALALGYLRRLLPQRGARALGQVGDGPLALGGGGGLLDVLARGGFLPGTGHEASLFEDDYAGNGSPKSTYQFCFAASSRRGSPRRPAVLWRTRSATLSRFKWEARAFRSARSFVRMLNSFPTKMSYGSTMKT